MDRGKQYPPPKNHVKINRYSDLVGLAIIILLGIIIYSNSFSCSFHFDDFADIVNNRNIRNLSDVKAWWNFSPNRPIGIFTFVLNYHFNQLDVRYWHLINLVIHLINSCLVWWLTLLIFSSPVLKDHPVVKHKKVLAFLTALLFVSHPLATQSVTYIVQRFNSMAAMFYLLSLALYMKARLSNKRKILQYLLFAGSLIAIVLAMLTKENAFTLPFAIVLFELFFLRTKKLSINFKDYRMILLMAAFLGVILIIPLKYSFSIFKPIPPSLWHPYILTPSNYFLTQFSVIIKYIQLLFLPINLNVDYDFPISNNFFGIRTFLSFLVLLSLIILAIFLFHRSRVISFGIFWFFLTLSIESSFIPIEDVIFEHRTYLPSFGFFLILSYAIYVFLRDKYKFLPIAVLTIIIGSNSYLTFQRNKVWKDDLSLWSDNVAKAPNITRPICNRSAVYGDLGVWDKAIADYSTLIRIAPKYILAYSNRGNAYGKLGQWAKAIADYTMVIGIDPNFKNVYFNRGVAYDNLGQVYKAISDYSRAIEIDPQYRDAYFSRGIAYGSLQKWNEVIADYSRVIRIDPKYPNAYSNRGIAYGILGQLDNAIADCSKAIEIDPKYTDAYFNRGITYGKLQQWDKAIADYSRTIKIDPNYTDAYFNRGVAYGNLGQWEKAIADYSRAIEIDPKFGKAYSNRDVAYRKLHSEKRR